MATSPVRCGPGRAGSTGGVRARVVAALARQWRTVVVVGLAAIGGLYVVGLLALRPPGPPLAHAVQQAGVTAWAVLAAWALARRRPGPREAGARSAWAALVLTCVGATSPDVDVQWLSCTGLVILPVASVVEQGRRGTACTTLLSMIGAVVIAVQAHASPTAVVCTASVLLVFVAVPVTAVLVLLTQLATARDRAQHLAVTDRLTGLLNRHGMDERLPGLAGPASTAGEQLWVLVVDVDRFKAVNDAHGHDGGDAVLAAVAAALRSTVREGDLLVRLGGEEFAWWGRFDGATPAADAAERARVAVASLRLSGLPAVTVSVGAAGAPLDAPGADGAPAVDLSRLLVRADDALYDAKRAGRDRVVVSAPPGPARVAPDRTAVPVTAATPTTPTTPTAVAVVP